MWPVLCIAVLSALIAPSHEVQPTFDNQVMEEMKQLLQKEGIPEDTEIDDLIGKIKCTDADGDQVQYLIESDYLYIGRYTGEVFLRALLDKETQENTDTNDNTDNYRVTFRCWDGNSRPVEVSYEITIQDVNDEVPRFVSNRLERFTFSVSENEPPNIRLDGMVSVLDDDADHSNARMLDVRFDCGNDTSQTSPCKLFKLDWEEVKQGENTVTVELLQKLDFEQVQAYNIKAIAIDEGDSNRRNTGSTGFLIIVLDSQDTNPEFVQIRRRYEVDEELPVGTIVNFQLSAQDGDAGSRRPLTFEILDGLDEPRGYNLFEIGAVRPAGDGIYAAEVKVKARIDFENITSYNFTAKATELDSNGSLTSASTTQKFKVSILDKNDNKPLFNKDIYSISIPEATGSLTDNTIPTDIEVEDRDTFKNSRYEVKIVQQTYPGTFRIQPQEEMTGLQEFYLVWNQRDKLDYENPAYRRHVLQLEAVETRTQEQFSSTATVSVSLTDLNDHDPLFSQTRYETTIRDDEPMNSIILTLSATDQDSGLNGDIVYSAALSSDDYDYTDTFRINDETGAISLIKDLTNTRNTRYSFLASATDQGTEITRSTDVFILVTVILRNTVGPVFTSTNYGTTVESGSSVLQPPLRLQATDPSDSNITYRIVGGNTPTNSFVLDPISGQLTLREPVRFDQTANATGYFTLVVEASDNGDPPLTTEAFVTVTVLARNEYRPKFDPQIYRVTVPETVQRGTFLVDVSATDADVGSNGKITYRQGEGGFGNFEVKNGNKVYIADYPSFDFDRTNRMQVEILAVDGGFPQRTGTATLSVTITDENNKPPRFVPQSYNAVIREDASKGTTVLRLSATDPDAQSRLEYTLLKSTIIAYRGSSTIPSNADLIREVFAVDQASGVIIVSPSGPGLGSGLVTMMEFQVQVKDALAAPNTGNQTDKAYITIVVETLPDTNLYFELPWTRLRPEYRLQFSETDPVNTEVITLHARDPVDSENTVPIRYQIVSGTNVGDYFRLGDSEDPGKLILQKELDYERGSVLHYVVIEAIKDRVLSLPSRTATASIYLDVLNANDNSPVFTQETYRFTVLENIPVGSSISTLRAYDLDGPSFGVVEILMGVGQYRNDFIIEPISTQITDDSVSTQARLLVNRRLDYEKTKNYDLTVIARDGSGTSGGARLTTQARVFINVIDVNDNWPTFRDKSRSFSVPETAPSGSPLGRVVASDEDSGDNGKIFYSLKSDSVIPLRMFTIEEETGVLKTRQSLQGLSGTYKLNVVATDKGSPPLNSSIPVTVKVQGVEDDDGTPKWMLPEEFVVYVTENNQTKLDIQVRAVARTPNANITYSLGHFDNDHLNFRIDPITGDIYVTADLDREIQETYTLLLEAKDTINTDKMSRRPLKVILIDVNDNDPSFKKSRYAACPSDFQVPTVYTTPDDTLPGTIVGHAVACDPDGPGNDEMYYERYTGNKLCQENVDTALEVMDDGSIRNKITLDYEDKVQYLVCVTVRAAVGKRRKRDYDEREMIDTDKVAYIIVRVIDRNDNGPQFPDGTVQAVLETFPAEDFVIQVLANDPDGPLNNGVLYAIKSIMYYPPNGQNPFSSRGAFTINPDNGVVLASLPVYRDFAHGYFELEIQAFDFKNRMFNDTVNVTLVVYQKSQILKVVLDVTPYQGQRAAMEMIRDLNEKGKEDGLVFFFIKVSEHRSESKIVESQTDVCFVIVEGRRPYDASEGLGVLDSGKYNAVLRDFKKVDRGTCYSLPSTEEKVKWRDLWWVLVAVAIFIFICALILLITICILYDRYKKYMETQRTYLVPQ